jgi:hypothetical protein
MVRRLALFGCAALLLAPTNGLRAEQREPVRFSTAFEGGSLGKVERLGDAAFRCAVQGQRDEHGRNRQASWYFFRLDGVRDRDVTLTLTDFVGEYNGRPGACPMTADTVPVFSRDGETWQHFPAMEWNAEAKEATLRFRSPQDTIWIAHVPPYTHSRVLRLLEAVRKAPCARVEVIGKSAQGRDLHRVVVTNFAKPDAGKRTVWLQAREHAWEAPTSYVFEGALRFLTSDDPQAAALRDRVVFHLMPTADPDGCANGAVRFNALGYDLNRHWDEVDPRRPEFLKQMPEISYLKKAILDCAAARGIDLLVNMHNTETAEFLETHADDPAVVARMKRLDDLLAAKTTFDPSAPVRTAAKPDGSTNALWREARIPVVLMEQRISSSKKLGRRPTVEDRLAFGQQLIAAMAESVLP